MAAILDFIKLAQGWQLHTHLDIIMVRPDKNNQNRKKTASNKTRLRQICRLGCQTIVIIWNDDQKCNYVKLESKHCPKSLI